QPAQRREAGQRLACRDDAALRRRAPGHLQRPPRLHLHRRPEGGRHQRPGRERLRSQLVRPDLGREPGIGRRHLEHEWCQWLLIRRRPTDSSGIAADAVRPWLRPRVGALPWTGCSATRWPDPRAPRPDGWLSPWAWSSGRRWSPPPAPSTCTCGPPDTGTYPPSARSSSSRVSSALSSPLPWWLGGDWSPWWLPPGS